MADRDRAWDRDEADRRVREWAGTDGRPNTKYKEAHVWYDSDEGDEWGAYKLPIADVVDGRLMAVPHAIFAAGGVMDGARGGVKIPDDERERVKKHLAKYYAKLGETPPWER
ncbi:hypothetical protein [Nonomuraea sp. NPDC050310]|uniref:hypothetical protein n=1 Tax=Nonomuraea sp. NPDC050310 TaxID=3154935 RepID=UPI0033E08415